MTHLSLPRRLGATLDRVSPATADRARRLRARAAGGEDLRARVEGLERDVRELRQLSRRLADTLDVIAEVLVPALDRDEDRVRASLERLAR